MNFQSAMGLVLLIFGTFFSIIYFSDPNSPEFLGAIGGFGVGAGLVTFVAGFFLDY